METEARRADQKEPEPEADPEAVARNIVLRRLTASAQTRQQLREALARRNVPPEVAERVLDRMAEVGLVDDHAYAHEYVRARRAGRSSSRRALRQELGRKGVPDDVVEHALSDVDDEADRVLAKEFVTRKWASVARLEPAAGRRRLVGMLARRGFAPGLAFAVIREVEAEQGLPPEIGDDLVASQLVADGTEVNPFD